MPINLRQGFDFAGAALAAVYLSIVNTPRAERSVSPKLPELAIAIGRVVESPYKVSSNPKNPNGYLGTLVPTDTCRYKQTIPGLRFNCIKGKKNDDVQFYQA